MNIIREAASRSATFTWRSYDEQFRLRQESEVESWGKINSDLWLRLMTSSTVTTASTIPNSSNTSRLDPTRVLGTCFDFNDGFCHGHIVNLSTSVPIVITPITDG